MEAQEGDLQKVIDRLKESKLVIALGIRGNYLVASIGASLECLEKLGQGDRLDRPRRVQTAGKIRRQAARLPSATSSEAMNQQMNNQKKNIDQLRGTCRPSAARRPN